MTRLTREMETRSMEMIQAYNMNYEMLGVPPGVKKEGYTYYWADYINRGEPTFTVEKLAAKGWTLVPRERAKTKSIDPLNRQPLAGQYICVNELILMEAPDEVANYYIEQDHRFNENRIRSMRHVTSSPMRISNY